MNKICEICGDQGKYKCPTCLIFYCSVICCKKHREKECEVIIRESKEELQKKRKLETMESTVPEEKLKLLRNNDVKKLLTNHHLRNLLVTVDNAENAEVIMQKAMQEPIFVEFADACLKTLDAKSEGEREIKDD